MKRVLAVAVGVLAALFLVPAYAGASTLTDCLAEHHVCVTGSGRGMITGGQQDRLERQIGQADIYLVVARPAQPATTAR